LGNGFRALRRRILTPDVSETSLAKRGFHVKDEESKQVLEKIGETFLTGYGDAIESATPEETGERLAAIPTRFRGFSYEGAGMGLAMLDGLPFGHKHHVEDFLAGPGDPHNYLVLVGIGWAMARLPRFAWPSPKRYDPLLRWLVLDGYGFHQAYFHTQKYVHEQRSSPHFSWPAGNNGYATRVIDQGIGRALWFVCGSDADLATSTVAQFAAHRQGDLYAGIGLAATYAGGVEEDELRLLLERAGKHRGELAQGSAFAAEARVRGGLVVPHNELATNILCGLPVEKAARITQDVRPGVVVDGDVPAYQTWREDIAREILAVGSFTS
jgi:hypothetical protein